MRKRIAAVLAIAVTAAIGMSSSASADSDPVYFTHEFCLNPGGTNPLCPVVNAIPTVSARQLLGPELSEAACSSVPETYVPLGVARAYVCLKY